MMGRKIVVFCSLLLLGGFIYAQEPYPEDMTSLPPYESLNSMNPGTRNNDSSSPYESLEKIPKDDYLYYYYPDYPYPYSYYQYYQNYPYNPYYYNYPYYRNYPHKHGGRLFEGHHKQGHHGAPHMGRPAPHG